VGLLTDPWRLACALYTMIHGCIWPVQFTKAVGDCRSGVGFKWSQLENFVIFVIVSSSSNSS
jgi:hypothetical protein